MPQRVCQLFQGKKLADPGKEYASHVPMLLGYNILPHFFLDYIKAQNARLESVVTGQAKTPASKATTAYTSVEEFEQKLRSSFHKAMLGHEKRWLKNIEHKKQSGDVKVE